MQLSIRPYTDGPQPPGFRQIVGSWKATWQQYYSDAADLEFLSQTNLKLAENRSSLPTVLKYIERIRNPDLYFVETTTGTELGGIEITDHSPDGSNVEKRYPFLWAGRRAGINAFTVTRYLKQRPARKNSSSVQINRFPARHAKRNLQLVNEWTLDAKLGHAHLVQYLPLRELHLEDINLVPKPIRDRLLSWPQLGEFFAHSLAAKVLSPANTDTAHKWLAKFKDQLSELARACIDNATRETSASSLLKQQDRWIQVYNTRPDSGHWERGEGQFDSIDGRIMFTLDEISFLDSGARPKAFEFWLPQLVSTHPWISEQRDRGFGSKRLRNIMVELTDFCTTRFADQLVSKDWKLLTQNPQLLLERLDWAPGIYRVATLVPTDKRRKVARSGNSNRSADVISSITDMLSDEELYFSSHRAYISGWRDDLQDTLLSLSNSATVLVPRIPAGLLDGLATSVQCNIVSAEQCSKDHLLMLRQLHRAKS